MSLVTSSLAPLDDTEPARRRRRRPRAPVACDTCRTRKVKCDGALPCSNCSRHSFDCSYKGKPPFFQSGQDARSTTTSTTKTSATRSPAHTTPCQIQYPTLQASGDGPIAPASPASLIDSPVSRPSIRQTSPRLEPILSSDRKGEGVGDVNRHTEGDEFYGHTGTFYFLSRLRSQANSQRLRRLGRADEEQRTGKSTADSSVVNLLHSAEYTTPTAVDGRSIGGPGSSTHQRAESPRLPNGALRGSVQAARILDSTNENQIGRECVRLYFVNLHRIHPILDQASFVSRCEKGVWTDGAVVWEAHSSQVRARSRFLALYNIVLAIGAITADETSLVMWDGIANLFEGAGSRDRQDDDTPTYPPIRLARLFFERTKSFLEDTFESSSFETAQTLFLMSIFCQNALKPHSCYMYSGMAIRTAFAIGIPTSFHSEASQHSLFWWALYSHEIEMCIAAGRQTFLRESSHYRIPLPRRDDIPGQSPSMINCMVYMAQILIDVSNNLSRIDDDTALTEKSRASVEVDRRLSDWRANLPADLNFETWSMEDAELTTKQKIVLKLRFLNAKILLHRSFLISASAESQREKLAMHTVACVDAAKESIGFVYNTYLHRPYFRTWWYNCTYILDATMVLLYVVLSDIYPIPDDSILQYVEKSLQIFASMKVLAVARRCAEVTKEVLAIAKKLHRERNGQVEQSDGGSEAVMQGDNVLGQFDNLESWGHVHDAAVSEGDLYASLMDTNLVFNFLNFEDWNAWSDIGFA